MARASGQRLAVDGISPVVFNEIESPNDLLPFCPMEQFNDGATARREGFARFMDTCVPERSGH